MMNIRYNGDVRLNQHRLVSASGIVRAALVSGAFASVLSSVALALLAKRENKSALQPVNSTSHWLHGDEAADYASLDVAHSAVGYATHHASAVFWALPFQAWLAMRPPGSARQLIRDAAVMTGIAAAVDYAVTPKRFTPGWELVLSKPAIAAAYVAFACGLAAGSRILKN